MIKVSVIVPFYNCEETIEQCIDSILAQTVKYLEVICIDDGSRDNSISIIRRKQELDRRIVLLQQHNQGAAVARNQGIKKARGKYTAFLDADDFFLDADALENMIAACEKNQVYVCGTNIRIYRHGRIAEDRGYKDVKIAASKCSILDYEDFQFDYGYYGFLFNTEFLRDNKLFFPNYRRYQDPVFLVRAMYTARKFCFVENALYCYRAPNVISRFDANKVKDLLNGIIDNLEFAKTYKLTILFDKTVERLEEEYAHIICHNIVGKETEIMQLLLDANNIVQTVRGKEYIISPLKKIFSSISLVEAYQKKEFENKLLNADRIYVYGAGMMTLDFFEYLQRKNLFCKAAGILVTEKAENPSELRNIVVQSIDEYKYQRGDIIILALSGIHQNEVINKLQEKDICAYERLDTGIFDEK